MEMQFKNEIDKLADIVVWADGKIIDGGYYEEKYRSDASTAYCHVKAHELWKIRDVALETMERQTVYTNALNEDIADKASKINLLEKEIEGRKEGYVALKELMDTKYISIDEHNDICKTYENKVAELRKESEKWQDLAKMNRDTICNQYDVCAELKEEVEKLKADLIHEREKNEKLAKDHAELENDMRKYTADIISQSGTICNLKKELDARGEEIRKLEEKVKHQRENLDGINKTLEIRTKENESLIAVRNNLNKEIKVHEDENARLTEKIIELKKKEDDHGKSGFKRYIEHLIEEEERAVPERFKERLNKEITEIFTKEEETEIKGNGRTNSGRYPWGAKVNDIPCGSDSIE